MGRAAGTAEQVHLAILRRATPGGGGPVTARHRDIARVAYGSARLSGRTLSAVARWATDPAPVELPGQALAAAGALNGMVGDSLERAGSALAGPMTVRQGGRPVEPIASDIAAAFPSATPTLAVFVHGLASTENTWSYGAEAAWGRPGVTYGTELAADLDITPVYIRYNTGRTIAANAVDLDRMVDRLVAGWPVPVAAVVLVGHSMGGLVATTAAAIAAERAASWASRLRSVVALGSPHRGAPLAQGIHALAAVLGVFPESRPFAELVDDRSVGIKDLRRGVLPDAVTGVRYRALAATVSARPDHVIGWTLGDLLVRRTSARGHGDDTVVGGLHHIHLVNHPRVYHHLRAWLAEDLQTLPGDPP